MSSSEFGAILGKQHGWKDGLGGKPRLPRPDPDALRLFPDYAASYQAAYDIAYNRAFGERERIIRSARLLEARDAQRHRDNDERDRQAERE